MSKRDFADYSIVWVKDCHEDNIHHKCQMTPGTLPLKKANVCYTEFWPFCGLKPSLLPCLQGFSQVKNLWAFIGCLSFENTLRCYHVQHLSLWVPKANFHVGLNMVLVNVNTSFVNFERIFLILCRTKDHPTIFSITPYKSHATYLVLLNICKFTTTQLL